MSVNTTNMNSFNTYNRVPFRAQESNGLNIVTKPIDKVENIVNNTVDTFVPEPENEEKKKSHKTAIRVGSTVLVLSAIVALFNPKFSSALVNKLKTKSTKAGNKAKVDNSLLGKWNSFKESFLKGVTNIIQVLNNGNSAKDELFTKICSKTSVTKNIHQGITKGFDSISKKTVFSKNKKVAQQMNTLDAIMKQYKDRLSPKDRAIFEEKLKEIDKLQEYFNVTNTGNRLKTQETLMKDLEEKFVAKLKAYKDGFKFTGGEKNKDIFTFWAEDILMPQRNKLEESGNKVVNSLVGDGKTQKGAYREVIDLLAKHLNREEKSAFEESIKQAEQLLRNANKTECVEYFDKKRDLMLGSAPTDILTAVLSLIASGIAIGTADSKEDRLSRTISGALPVVAGMGVSTVLTALLFSGGKGMALGAASSMGLSILGSSVSHQLFPKTAEEHNLAQQKTNKKGIQNNSAKYLDIKKA